MSKPVLKFPNSNAPFVIEIDASDFAVGGILSQKQSDGAIYPVAYFSNTLDTAKQKWSTYTKEAYALVVATRHSYTYVAGKSFILLSDHNPLVYLRKQKDPRGKYARWIAELEEFQYNIQYIPGTATTKADALSRVKLTASNVVPIDNSDAKIYLIQFVEGFDKQVKSEHEDETVRYAKRKIIDGENIDHGVLKRVRNQLRVEQGILTKSGRPSSLWRYIVDTYHSTP